MKFWRRLKYYGIGLGGGLIMVFMIFGNRGCSWLPENRVLNEISESKMLISEKAKCQQECLNLSDEKIYSLFVKKEGDVLFKKSEPHADPRKYVIEGESGDKTFELTLSIKKPVMRNEVDMKNPQNFTELDTIFVSKILSINSEGANCNCSDLSQEANINFYLPAELVVEKLLSKPIRFTNKVKECHMDQLNLTVKDLDDMLKQENVINGKCKPLAKPNPVYVLEGSKGEKRYEMYYEVTPDYSRIVEVKSLDGEQTICPEDNKK